MLGRAGLRFYSPNRYALDARAAATPMLFTLMLFTLMLFTLMLFTLMLFTLMLFTLMLFTPVPSTPARPTAYASTVAIVLVSSSSSDSVT